MHKVSQHMQSTKAQHQQKKRKSHLEPSVTLREHVKQDSTAKRRRRRPSHAQAYFSPPRNLPLTRKNPDLEIRGGNAAATSIVKFDLKKSQCFVQILAFKSRPWWSSFNASCQERLAKQYNRKTLLETKYLSETPWCSHSMLRHMPTGPRDHCAQLTCGLRRLWSHIPISPEIIVSSWQVPSKDHGVTFSLAQRSLCPVDMCLKRPTGTQRSLG